MARLLIETNAKLRVRRWRQGLWDLIREIGADGRAWNRRDLLNAAAEGGFATRAAPHPDTIRDYLRGLVAAGIVAVNEDGSYRLVEDLGPEAPRVRIDGTRVPPSLGQDHMWRTIQMSRGGFSATDLAIGARTEEVSVSVATAKSYVTRLCKAGYLDILVPGGPGHEAIYALKPGMRTGPRAPMILATKVVWDPNLGKAMGAAEADEEAGDVAR